MSIAVTCSCGKSYIKADHHFGKEFRCHNCGQMVLVDGETVEPSRAPRRPEGIIIARGYRGLWVCAVGLLAFAGCLGVGPVVAAAGAKPNPQLSRALVPILVGVSLIGCFGLAVGYLAWRLAERFVIDDQGIAWHNRGRVRAALTWSDIRHVDLAGTTIRITGPAEVAPLEITAGLQTAALLKRLQRSLDWEAVSRPPTAPDGAPTFEPQSASDVAAHALPLIRSRSWPLIVGLLVALTLGTLTLLACRATLAPPAGKPEANDAIGKYALFAFAWGILPALTILFLAIALLSWLQFRVEADGIVLRSALRSRRFEWEEIQSVRAQVRITEMRHHGAVNVSARNVLTIRLRNETTKNFDFAADSSFFRDVIVAAAARAGVALQG